MQEFELITKFLTQQAGNRDDVILGIGDDCALLKVPPDCELAIATDSLVAGIHFPDNTTAYDIGYKTLAANLSDLAAMGAEPIWVTLAMTLPTINESWLKEFCTGFFALLKQYNMQLIGGDTTRGPLSLTAQVYGLLPPGKALRRTGAQPGDAIYVTGTLGDAGWALQSDSEYFLQKLNRPTPRIKEGLALRDIATSAIDISDGLAADLGHILQQSKVGATIYTDDLPLSDELLAVLSKEEAVKLALAAGDDYELCFTAPVGTQRAVPLPIPCSKIGIIEEQPGLRILDHAGNPVILEQKGYEHSWSQT